MEELPRPRSYRVLLRWSGRDCALLLPAGVSGELLFEAQLSATEPGPVSVGGLPVILLALPYQIPPSVKAG